MEPSDLPPLPPIKKRKAKTGKRGTMSRSRSFVAEMFHNNKKSSIPNNASSKKWSTNDIQLLQKLGISPVKDRNSNNTVREKLKISPNLHPDLKTHAYEEQIDSLHIELQNTKNNLMRAAEYGQHLIDENQKLESVVLELRNEAAEYIAQLCELREENETFKLEVTNNEYSVNEYENKMYEIKSNKTELNNKLMQIKQEMSDCQMKLEMSENKCKIYENETSQYKSEMSKCSKESEALKTKVLVLQNTNHSLCMERDEINKKCHKIQSEMHILENEYAELCANDEIASMTDERENRFNISRRRSHSHSRSRSDKRTMGEEFEEKMDEIMNVNPEQRYTEILHECMCLFGDIINDQSIKSSDKNDEIDMELFENLLHSVRNKLNLKSENLKLSKSKNKFDTNLNNYIVSSDSENDKCENEIKNEYFADNEDLDNLPNTEMLIEPINDKQKACVEQFLVRYSENNSWKQCNESQKYEIEIEFNESVNLESKKCNNISISAQLLQSLTNLIENIMDLPTELMGNNSYFSMCGWFCGKAKEENALSDYSEHYLNILSRLDYNKQNRDEIYWVIYQLLNVIYKFYNNTNSDTIGKASDKKTKSDKLCFGGMGENVSDSESMSMVMTDSKSKYAQLKPPKRRNKTRSRASFHPLNNISSDDEDV